MSSLKNRRRKSALKNDDLYTDEIEERQKKRIGQNVSGFMEDDDDFEEVEVYVPADPADIHVKIEDHENESKSGCEPDAPKEPEPAPSPPPLSEEEAEERRREIRRRMLKGKKIHRDIMLSTYFFVALFAGIIIYLGFFTYAKSDEYLANEYNSKRQSVYADKYIRGDIVSSDGEILATTKVSEDGSEKRVYPFKNVFAHAVGYSTKGNTGIEALANSYLLGSHINPISQAISELNGEKIPGDTVVSTINASLQTAAYDALGDRKGAVIVTEVKTAKVLAMVSKPDFNPNKINEIWDELVSDETNSNLVNRATQGLYPPGSTFKIVTLLEYIRENPDTYEDFTYDCDGTYEIEDYVISCSKKTEHGKQKLKEAFANSCNGAFAVIGQSLDLNALHTLCEKLGYNSAPDTNILSSKSRYKLTKENANLWSVLQTSIGQGETLTTPLQNLLIVTAVANGGVIKKPYLIDHIETESGSVVKTFASETSGKVMTASEARLLGEYLRSVVTEGTGGKAEGDGYTVAGKTGSAEWSKGKDTHAWFVGYAPYDDPEIAVSIVVEDSGSGGSVAAPIARKIFDKYFDGN